MEVALATNPIALTALIDRAAMALSGARSAAEILEAGEMAAPVIRASSLFSFTA